jgi:hypothetical protein
MTSTQSTVVEWPWSGWERNHIYADFIIYLILLILFSVLTLRTSSFRAYDAYHLVQSVQTTLLAEVRGNSRAGCRRRKDTTRVMHADAQ